VATLRKLPTRGPPTPRRRLALVLGIAAVVALVFFFPGSSDLLADWWWFREIGYQIVFTRTLTTRVILFLAGGGPRKHTDRLATEREFSLLSVPMGNDGRGFGSAVLHGGCH